jgi:protein gp37
MTDIRINWVILGTESGPYRRPARLEWMEAVVDQCRAAGVPVFVKQIELNGKVEKDFDKFPASLQYREFPDA